MKSPLSFRITRHTGVLAALLLLSGSAFASASGASPQTCAAIADAGARLACYDALFPPTAGNDRPVASPASSDEFGLSAAQRLERRGEPAAREPGALEATIVRVQPLRDGHTLVELDTGAMWRVTERAAPTALRAGKAVRIRPAAMGTFLLTPENGAALRAKRER